MGNYSIKNMFLNADPMVQGVMILLLIASLASWVVILEKTAILKRASKAIWMFKRAAYEIDRRVDPADFPGFTSKIVEAGLRESQDTAGGETRADFRERSERSMRAILSGRLDRVDARVNLLATVGATSPFVGLFGTVWGIMHSFIGIAASGETTLAVVAPGIAEALFATAMGLVAAIPAVIAYNKINNTIKKMTKEALAAIGVVGNNLARLRFSPEEAAPRPRRQPEPSPVLLAKAENQG
ncbi:MAG: MotA/TolQ/ExbB proton channel family protein [Deltaproteobacteria bacterium]|nr:MotA/TolQ/ExbB proton channel family protein [Deltaproteobacteria bacterium]